MADEAQVRQRPTEGSEATTAAPEQDVNINPDNKGEEESKKEVDKKPKEPTKAQLEMLDKFDFRIDGICGSAAFALKEHPKVNGYMQNAVAPALKKMMREFIVDGIVPPKNIQTQEDIHRNSNPYPPSQ